MKLERFIKGIGDDEQLDQVINQLVIIRCEYTDVITGFVAYLFLPRVVHLERCLDGLPPAKPIIRVRKTWLLPKVLNESIHSPVHVVTSQNVIAYDLAVKHFPSVRIAKSWKLGTQYKINCVLETCLTNLDKILKISQ